jgi:type I restriction enzyme, S subunit
MSSKKKSEKLEFRSEKGGQDESFSLLNSQCLIPRLRFPEFREAEGWEVTPLGQLAKLVRGPFGGSLKKEIFVSSGYAVYEQQHAIYSDFRSFRYFITEEKFRELRRFAIAANDIIMSCSGTMGKFAIIPDDAADGVINQALLKLTPNGYCNIRFLKEVLELPSVQEKLLSQSAGGAIKNVVSVEQIKALGTSKQKIIPISPPVYEKC